MKSDILIIGAGAAGLMAARELGRAGMKVTILEAHDRIGGRIFPLDEKVFGYPVQAGAEFVHGKAPVTKALLKEAGLGYKDLEGEMWKAADGKFIKEEKVVPEQDAMSKQLQALQDDMSIGDFLNTYFSDERYADLRQSVLDMAEGYDAADPFCASTFALRSEWLDGADWEQGNIIEGYQSLLKFLEKECNNLGVRIILNSPVKAIEWKKGSVTVQCVSGERYSAQKTIVTVSLGAFSQLYFEPQIPEKSEAVTKMGFGPVIKIHYKFTERWWLDSLGADLSHMWLVRTTYDVPVLNWWTQYPDEHPLLTGWLAGPRAKEFANADDAEIVAAGIHSLSKIFKVEEAWLQERVMATKVTNWPADPFVRGAYSYATLESEAAQKILMTPVDETLYFAGEALYTGKDTATVEGALASGKEVAAIIADS